MPTVAPSRHADPPSDTGHHLPAFDRLDLFSTLVGLLGSLGLVVLAGSCAGHVSDGGGNPVGCSIRVALAGAVFLITMIHVVAILLMESIGYRGLGERLFAWVLIGVVGVALLTSALVA